MDAMTPTPDAQAKRRRVIAAMLISTFMAAAEVTVISTAMPTIVSRLGGFSLFTWAFGIYLLGQAVMTPIYGRLADQLGRRPVFLASTALFLIGSLLCGFAWSMPSLIVFRAIQGFGGGGLVPLATTIIGDVCAPAERPRVIGYVSGIWGIAAIAGPLIGSLCVGTVGWPWVFWINLPIGAVTIVLVATSFSEPVRTIEAGSIDYAGSALLAFGIGAGMAALVQWDAFGAGTIAALLAVSAVLLAGFAVRERRATIPMLALHLLRRPIILAANISALLLGALVIELTAFVPPAVQGLMGRSALVAGFVLGIMTVSWTSASMGFGRALVRLPLRRVALGASCLLIGGSAVLVLIAGLPAMLVACVALGFGLGTGSLVFTVAVQNAVTTGDRGRATSLFYFSRMVGQAVGAAALGGVLNAGLALGGPGMMGDLRGLMGTAGRASLPPGELDRLLPVLGNALSGVFACGLGIAVLTVVVAMLVPRSLPQAAGAVIKP